MFSNLQAEMYQFYANLDFFFPIQYPDIAFSYGILGNVKSLVKGCFKAVYNSEAHLGKREGEREVKEGRG